MVITTFIDLTRTTVVYRLAYMKKSGNRLSRCPDFVIHYTFSGDCERCRKMNNSRSLAPGTVLFVLLF